MSFSLSQERSTNVRHTPETKLPFSTPTFQLTSNCAFTQIFLNLTSSVYFNCPVHNGLLCQNFSLVLQFLRPATWHSRSLANGSLSCIQERLAERLFSNESCASIQTCACQLLSNPQRDRLLNTEKPPPTFQRKLLNILCLHKV